MGFGGQVNDLLTFSPHPMDEGATRMWLSW